MGRDNERKERLFSQKSRNRDCPKPIPYSKPMAKAEQACNLQFVDIISIINIIIITYLNAILSSPVYLSPHLHFFSFQNHRISSTCYKYSCILQVPPNFPGRLFLFLERSHLPWSRAFWIKYKIIQRCPIGNWL